MGRDAPSPRTVKKHQMRVAYKAAYDTFKESLLDFYAANAPSKAHKVPAILKQFRGREHKIVAGIQKKYGVNLRDVDAPLLAVLAGRSRHDGGMGSRKPSWTTPSRQQPPQADSEPIDDGAPRNAKHGRSSGCGGGGGDGSSSNRPVTSPTVYAAARKSASRQNSFHESQPHMKAALALAAGGGSPPGITANTAAAAAAAPIGGGVGVGAVGKQSTAGPAPPLITGPSDRAIAARRKKEAAAAAAAAAVAGGGDDGGAGRRGSRGHGSAAGAAALIPGRADVPMRRSSRNGGATTSAPAVAAATGTVRVSPRRREKQQQQQPQQSEAGRTTKSNKAAAGAEAGAVDPGTPAKTTASPVRRKSSSTNHSAKGAAAVAVDADGGGALAAAGTAQGAAGGGAEGATAKGAVGGEKREKEKREKEKKVHFNPELKNRSAIKVHGYKELRYIGRGKFATAYRAIRTADGKSVALKHIHGYADLKPKQKKRQHQEIRFLQKLEHPNIVHYFDSFKHEGSLIIVCEWAAAGDLKRQIQKIVAKGKYLSELNIWKYFHQIASAVQYMHEHRILHRDLKPANILLTAEGQIKVTDFGLSRGVSQDTAVIYSKVGTPLYMAPEVIIGKGYGWESDIWSLGCILYELANLINPFRESGLDLKALFQKVCRAELPAMVGPGTTGDRYSSHLRKLVTRMLQKDPTKRPSMDNVVDYSKCMLALFAQRRVERKNKQSGASSGSGGDGGDGVNGGGASGTPAAKHHTASSSSSAAAAVPSATMGGSAPLAGPWSRGTAKQILASPAAAAVAAAAMAVVKPGGGSGGAGESAAPAADAARGGNNGHQVSSSSKRPSPRRGSGGGTTASPRRRGSEATGYSNDSFDAST